MRQFTKPTEVKFSKKKYSADTNENFFLNEEPIEFNDLDSNMMNRNLVKFLPTDALRLELLIERTENNLKVVNEEIISAEMLEFSDENEKDFLNNKKRQLLTNLLHYKAEYRSLGSIYKFADMLADLKVLIKQLFIKFKIFLFSIPFFALLLNKFPGQKNKQKLKMMNMLHKKIYRELNKPSRADSKKLETLFLKTEEIR
jgi:hypothetical protein